MEWSDDSREDKVLYFLVTDNLIPGLGSTLPCVNRIDKKRDLFRNTDEAFKGLYREYLCDTPRYKEELFERCFCKPSDVFKQLFDRIIGVGIFVLRENVLTDRK